jgi:Mn-dependent DtxR family transcriptional regulator
LENISWRWLPDALPWGLVPPSSARTPVRSDSTEDHLERIQELVDRHGYARVSDLAEALGLNRSTVSNMVRRLAARGFVNYQRYRGFTLTPAGRAVASHIRDRHETLSAWLGLLGLERDTIEQEVEDIEHHLKPQTLRALSGLVAYWRERPEQLKAFRRFLARTEMR